MTIYLYKKTHNITGMQYLGKTIRNPFKYLGSGIDWNKHLVEFGADIKTEILKECSSKEELIFWGRYYSKLWNIVESKEWANKIPETGGGPGAKPTKKQRLALSKRQTGEGNVSKRPDFKEKHSGKNHWMNRPEHSNYIHVMTRPDVREKVTGKNSGKYDPSLFTFHNASKGIQVTLSANEFRKQFDLGQSGVSRLIHGKFKQFKGWVIIKE